MSDFTSETPTSFDLARWLFLKCEAIQPSIDRIEILDVMRCCMEIVKINGIENKKKPHE